MRNPDVHLVVVKLVQKRIYSAGNDDGVYGAYGTTENRGRGGSYNCRRNGYFLVPEKMVVKEIIRIHVVSYHIVGLLLAGLSAVEVEELKLVIRIGRRWRNIERIEKLAW